jgi:hypothetical protein
MESIETLPTVQSNSWRAVRLTTDSRANFESVVYQALQGQLVLQKRVRAARSTSWRWAASLVELESEIRSFLSLQENWDGEGAAPISAEVIDNCLRFLGGLDSGWLVPEAYPNTNGTISLCWRWPGGRATMEIGRTRFSWVVVNEQDPDSQPVTCSGDAQAVSDMGVKDLFAAIARSKVVNASAIVRFKMSHDWLSAIWL